MNQLAIFASPSLPALLTTAEARTQTRFWEFFAAQIRNKNTRRAYGQATWDFLAWCESARVASIAEVQPLHVAAYIEQLGRERSAPTVKQRLAAIRHLFDWLVTGQVMPMNPAASVRGPSHSVKRGKTPVLDPLEARALLDSIDVTMPVGLRDRALIGLMIYSFARIGAALAMKIEDVYVQKRRLWRRAASAMKCPAMETRLPQANAYAMIRRRALAAGIKTRSATTRFGQRGSPPT
jgi:integrase/recombinase XerC